MNTNKRPSESAGNNAKRNKSSGHSKATSNQGGSSNGKSKTETRESLLRKIYELKLYGENDRYYQSAKVEVGPLELHWG